MSKAKLLKSILSGDGGLGAIGASADENQFGTGMIAMVVLLCVISFCCMCSSLSSSITSFIVYMYNDKAKQYMESFGIEKFINSKRNK